MHAGVTQFAENVLPLAIPPDITDAMADMVAECEGDPFQLAGALAEAGPCNSGGGAHFDGHRANPLDQCGSAGSGDPIPARWRANAAAGRRLETSGQSGQGCKPFAGVPAPADRDAQLVPEKERPAVDAIIRAVRAKGIDCAAWPQGGAGKIHASGIDGSGRRASSSFRQRGRSCGSPQFYSRTASGCLVGAAGVQTRSPIDARTGRDGNIDEAGIAQIF